MLKYVILGLTAFALMGCSTSMGNPNIRSGQALSRIQKGVTTQQQVQASLGQPQRRSVDAMGKEICYYSYSEADIDTATFIPFYGLFAGGATSSSTEVAIEFYPNKVVSNYTSTDGQYHFKNSDAF